METLLSYVEIIHFEHYIITFLMDQNLVKDIREDNKKWKALEYYEIKLCENIPKSLIVYEELNEFENNHTGMNIVIHDQDVNLQMLYQCKQKSHLLYTKYIQFGSIFEINISSQRRTSFFNLLNNYEQWMLNNHITLFDIIYLFDSCAKDMYALMHNSYFRFIHTEEFTKLQQCLFI